MGFRPFARRANGDELSDMNKDLPIAIAAGAASATLGFALVTGGAFALLLGYLAALPILVVGFAKGYRAAAIAGLSGAFLTGIFGGSMTALLFAVIHALPAWLIVRVTLMAAPSTGGQAAPQTGSVGFMPIGVVVAMVTLMAGVFFLIVATMLAQSEPGLLGLVEGTLNDAMMIFAAAATDAQRDTFVQSIAPWLPGAIGASWITMILINASIAMTILSRNGKSLRPRPIYSQIILPDFLAWPLVVSAALALVLDGDAGYAFRNLTLVLATPYFFLGLAVVHAMAKLVSYGKGLLIIFYITILMSVWCMLAVTGLGMIEQWAGIRRRFAGPKDNDEEMTS